jgi:hypothetical protein
MDLNELNSWLETNEGKEWGEQFKTPLLNKRNELLSQIKDSSAKLSEWDQRSAEWEKSLLEEKAIVEKYVVDKELQGLLKNANVFETLLPEVVKSLKNAYGITIKANGGDRMAIGKLKDKDGNEKEADLQAIVNEWSMSPEGLKLRQNNNSGGGATGSHSISQVRQQDLNPNSGRQLVQASDKDFEAWRQQELAKARNGVN